MLRIDLTPLEDTRTPERSCVYRAQAIIAGVTYEAHARLGASNALARHLVADGIAGSPVRVFHSTTPIRCTPWRCGR